MPTVMAPVSSPPAAGSRTPTSADATPRVTPPLTAEVTRGIGHPISPPPCRRSPSPNDVDGRVDRTAQAGEDRVVRRQVTRGGTADGDGSGRSSRANCGDGRGRRCDVPSCDDGEDHDGCGRLEHRLDPAPDRHVGAEIEDVQPCPSGGDRERERTELVVAAGRKTDHDGGVPVATSRGIEVVGDAATNGLARGMFPAASIWPSAQSAPIARNAGNTTCSMADSKRCAAKLSSSSCSMPLDIEAPARTKQRIGDFASATRRQPATLGLAAGPVGPDS